MVALTPNGKFVLCQYCFQWATSTCHYVCLSVHVSVSFINTPKVLFCFLFPLYTLFIHYSLFFFLSV